MRIIFDLGHPAHFHLFKNPIRILKDTGNDIEIIARQKDCLVELLNTVGWPYHLIPIGKSSLCAKGWQNLRAFRKALHLTKRKHMDFLVGTSLIVGPVARLRGSTSIIFSEDDADVIPIFSKLAYPFAHYIVTPSSLVREDHGKKHIRYNGYHELAHLHPDRFTPDESIFGELGLEKGQRYFLIRLVSLTAHHDIGARGVSTKQARFLVEHLSAYGRVFISAEKTVDKEMKKYLLPTRVERIFDVMAFADMVIGDSQTMIAEAAVLGTPALRCNSFVGRISYLEELEHKYGLTVGIRPENFDRLIGKIDEWLSQPDLKQEWKQKREVMLKECVDLTDWMIGLFNKLGKGERVDE